MYTIKFTFVFDVQVPVGVYNQNMLWKLNVIKMTWSFLENGHRYEKCFPTEIGYIVHSCTTQSFIHFDIFFFSPTAKG
jgi:hypothetical protein